MKIIIMLPLLIFSLVSFSFAQQNSCEDESLGLCAEASIQKNGYVTNDCLRVQNAAQDRCAAASIQKNGYVTNDCLRLN